MIYTTLTENIETVRKNLISVGMAKGLTAPETIKLSQTLDKLLDQQMNIINQYLQDK